MQIEEAQYPSLRGKTAFVTGGGSGIGACIVEHLAAQGANVGFVDMAAEPSLALVDRIAALGHPKPRFWAVDLRDIPAFQVAMREAQAAMGPVRILVNNAARDDRHGLEEVTPDYWDERMSTNLRHQFFAVQALRAGMRDAGGGAIINFGSTSWMIHQGGMPAYTTAKAAVIGLTRGLAEDLGPEKIRVNAIAPGWIMTERQKQLWVTEASLARAMDRQCLKETLVPADVARMVLWLAADDSRMVTAQTFVVDAGWV